jgi:CRP-like cAMP-binding protein
MQQLFQELEKFSSLSLDTKKAMESIVRKRELPKGYILLHAGGICNHLYFIKKGLTRTFYIKDGKDITDWLSLENTFATSVISLFTRRPDRRSIELLEDSTIIEIPHYELENLFAKYHDLERLGRLWSNYGIVQLQQRFDDLHFATAAERYAKLIQYNPTILQRVALGIIASFLGITQETLSRIRSQYSRHE